jgi:hypothetical protein
MMKIMLCLISSTLALRRGTLTRLLGLRLCPVTRLESRALPRKDADWDEGAGIAENTEEEEHLFQPPRLIKMDHRH